MRIWVWTLDSLSELRIWCCCDLWCRSPSWLRSCVAVAVVQASSCSSDLTPNLRTSTCCGCGPKKAGKKKKNKSTDAHRHGSKLLTVCAEMLSACPLRKEVGGTTPRQGVCCLCSSCPTSNTKCRCFLFSLVFVKVKITFGFLSLHKNRYQCRSFIKVTQSKLLKSRGYLYLFF